MGIKVQHQGEERFFAPAMAGDAVITIQGDVTAGVESRVTPGGALELVVHFGEDKANHLDIEIGKVLSVAEAAPAEEPSEPQPPVEGTTLAPDETQSAPEDEQGYGQASE